MSVAAAARCYARRRGTAACFVRMAPFRVRRSRRRGRAAVRQLECGLRRMRAGPTSSRLGSRDEASPDLVPSGYRLTCQRADWRALSSHCLASSPDMDGSSVLDERPPLRPIALLSHRAVFPPARNRIAPAWSGHLDAGGARLARALDCPRYRRTVSNLCAGTRTRPLSNACHESTAIASHPQHAVASAIPMCSGANGSRHHPDATVRHTRVIEMPGG